MLGRFHSLRFYSILFQFDLTNVVHAYDYYVRLYGDDVEDKTSLYTVLTTCAGFKVRYCSGGGLPVYVVLQVCQHRGCDFDKNARERLCFGAQSVLLDDNSRKFRCYTPFFNNYVQ